MIQQQRLVNDRNPHAAAINARRVQLRIPRPGFFLSSRRSGSNPSGIRFASGQMVWLLKVSEVQDRAVWRRSSLARETLANPQNGSACCRSRFVAHATRRPRPISCCFPIQQHRQERHGRLGFFTQASKGQLDLVRILPNQDVLFPSRTLRFAAGSPSRPRLFEGS